MLTDPLSIWTFVQCIQRLVYFDSCTPQTPSGGSLTFRANALMLIYLIGSLAVHCSRWPEPLSWSSGLFNLAIREAYVLFALQCAFSHEQARTMACTPDSIALPRGGDLHTGGNRSFSQRSAKVPKGQLNIC